MSEETATQEVADPVDTLPDQQMDFGSALDAAFAALTDQSQNLLLSQNLSPNQNQNNQKKNRKQKKLKKS